MDAVNNLIPLVEGDQEESIDIKDFVEKVRDSAYQRLRDYVHSVDKLLLEALALPAEYIKEGERRDEKRITRSP